jgi:hypothetical protein
MSGQIAENVWSSTLQITTVAKPDTQTHHASTHQGLEVKTSLYPGGSSNKLKHAVLQVVVKNLSHACGQLKKERFTT